MSRIAATFEQLRRQGRKALIPFLTAGDPQRESTVALMHALARAGADIIELGVPFSDPMADGPTIQRSSERALRNGTSLTDVIDMVAAFRRSDASTPVVLMGYANPIESMGYRRFAEAASRAGVDGVLVVDEPPEESAALLAELGPRGLDPIFLLAPTTTEARMREVAQRARGYIYYVSLTGVTGAAHLDLEQVRSKIPRIRTHIKLPVGVGFGIRDAATARAIAEFADAVVIGSRLVEEIERSKPDDLLENVGALIKGIRGGMDEKR